MKTTGKKKRKEFRGEKVVSGIAIGPAFLFGTRLIDFPQYWVHLGEIKAEIKRFEKALEQCRRQLDQIKSKLCRIQGREQITILDSHILFLRDELLVRSTRSSIETDHINAEWALHKTMAEIKQAFSRINQPYIQERKYDIDYIENAIQRNLMGQAQDFFPKVPRGSIVVAYDLSPAEILHLVRYKIGGFATETGGLSSHTAIVARSLQIPSVIGVEGIFDQIVEGDILVIDGFQGRVKLNPPTRELSKYRTTRRRKIASERVMKKEAQDEARTKDGHLIKILANMELTDEIDSIKESGAYGVGLYRTEFLFLDRETIPSEEEQEKTYNYVLKKLSPSEVTIRTVDLGADKLSSNQQYVDQPNPALGLRAIRYCMRERKTFTSQLRALIRASKPGNLKLCFPMISSVDEFRKTKKIFMDLLNESQKEWMRTCPKIALGVMIETPAAALEVDLLAQEVDFFSVGTNDLIQYLLAVDRTNELVSYLYTPLHPSVIRLLLRITEIARQYGKEVTLCGEMAADPQYLILVMALGFDRLSMNPASIPRIKKMIRMVSMEQAKNLLDKAMKCSSYKEMTKVLQTRMPEMFPHHFQQTFKNLMI